MRYLDRNVQVLFPVRLFYQSQGIPCWIPLLSFLEAACCRATDRGVLGKERLSGTNLEKSEMYRKRALCRRQGSMLCEYLKLHKCRKEKPASYMHEHEQHYLACLSELINTTWRVLLFTRKGIFGRINTICKLSWKSHKGVIKHDLINCCEIGMDFYLLK